MTYQELAALSIEELRKAPCECVSCVTCRGTGRLWTSSSMNQPFDEDFPCDECYQGIVETCDRCHLMVEYENENEEW